jgi:lipoate-protein ligase A
MHALGVEADLIGGEVNVHLPSPRSSVPCFEAPAGGEVVVRGRKLIGSAMRAHAGTILQHGAIVMDWDGRLQAGSMRLADDSVLRPQITTLRDEYDGKLERSALEESLVEAFSTEFAVEFEAAQLHDTECARQQELIASFSIGG